VVGIVKQSKPTHNERLLALFADRKWHSVHQLYAFCVWHSRKSELEGERYGCVFESRRDAAGDLEYRLISGSGEVREAEERLPSVRQAGASSSSEATGLRTARAASPTSSIAGRQLDLFKAA